MSILKIKNDKGKWENVKTIIGPRGKDGSPGPAGRGVPAGGQPGDVLMKNSEAEGDTIWGKVLTTVTEQNYVSGMEEESPILVVYKEAHTIDPTTDLVLAADNTLVSEKDSEVSYTIIGEPGVARSSGYDIRMNNMSSNQYVRFNDVRFYAYDEYGDYLTDIYVSFSNTTDGSNIIAPNTESALTPLFVPLNAYYIVIAEEQYDTGIPMENPEAIGNVIVRDVGFKALRDMLLEVESYENQIAVVKVTNPTEDRLRYPQFNMIFKDYYGFDLHISEIYDFTLNPGESRTFNMLTPIFYLAIFDTNAEIIKPVEIQPHQLKAEVGATTVPQGDFSYELITLDCGTSSAVEIKITNTRDFAIAIPKAFSFDVFDEYGTNLVTLQAYIGAGKLEAGGTTIISSGVTQDLSDAAYFEMSTDFWHSLDSNVDLIPIAGDTITTNEGLTLEFKSHKYENGTYTLYVDVTNTTESDIAVDDKLDLYDFQGNLIVTLVCWVGILGAGETSTSTSSYGENCTTKLYYMRYRKESE